MSDFMIVLLVYACLSMYLRYRNTSKFLNTMLYIYFNLKVSQLPRSNQNWCVTASIVGAELPSCESVEAVSSKFHPFLMAWSSWIRWKLPQWSVLKLEGNGFLFVNGTTFFHRLLQCILIVHIRTGTQYISRYLPNEPRELYCPIFGWNLQLLRQFHNFLTALWIGIHTIFFLCLDKDDYKVLIVRVLHVCISWWEKR